MPVIKVASNFINGAYYVSGTWADWAHLQLVFFLDEIEVQAPNAFTIPFGGTWNVLEVREHFDHVHTPNVGFPEYYGSVGVTLDEAQSHDTAWGLLKQLRDWFSTQSIDYNYSQNSNSYIRALLYVIGVDLDDYLPSVTLPSMEDGFPGAWRNVFFDLAGSSTPLHLSLNGTDGNDIIRSGIGNDTLGGADGNDTISTFAGNDILSGGDGYDILDGGEGKDAIFGGAGDDFIFFDAQDLDFNGGSGFDTARYQQVGDQRGLVIDMGAREIEVLITGNKADRVIASGEGPLLVSTGGGSDHITFQNGRGSPTIVIGGSGADTYNVQVDADSNDPVGILKIKVWGLTNENLPNLTLDMLGLPAGFDWSQIDLVMVNCEAQDRVTINGNVLQTEIIAEEMTYQWTDPITGDTNFEPMGTIPEILFRQAVEGSNFSSLWDRRVGHISSDFLNGEASVYAPRFGVMSRMVVEYRDSEGKTFIHGEVADEVLYDYSIAGADASSSWFDWGYGARVHYFETEYLDPAWQPGSWFVYGGQLGASGAISSSLTAYLPADL